MNSSFYMKSSINISNRKRTFSLPKTQPTKSSSNHRLSYKEIDQIQQIQTCPQVSQFRGLDNSMYIHRMNIDYGHLEEPLCWNKNKVYLPNHHQQMNKPNHHQIEEIPQQRAFQDIGIIKNTKAKSKTKSLIKLTRQNYPQLFTNSNYKQENKEIKSSYQQNKQNIENIPTELNESKISSKKLNNSLVSNSGQASKENSGVKFNSKHTIDKNNPKLKEVLAAKMYTNQSPIVKHLSQQSTYRNSHRQTQQNSTTRRAPHCRIVKTYVGGSKMQVKIISYPDSTQYMKLCGYGKSL